MIRAIAMLAVAGALAGTSPAGVLVFENARFRAVLGEDAAGRSLVHQPSSQELCPPQPGAACAAVRLGDRWHSASRAEWQDGRHSAKRQPGASAQCRLL